MNVTMDMMQNLDRERSAAANMLSPVRCNHCNELYDLTKTEVIRRYADCTLFRTPCCNRKADTRKWKGTADYTEDLWWQYIFG